jgi:hypothetical protein
VKRKFFFLALFGGLTFALVALLAWLAPSTAHVAAAEAHLVPVESLLNSDGTLNTSTGASGALDLHGWSVTLDSARGPILTRDAPAPAAPNANTWSAFAHNGLNDSNRKIPPSRVLT